VYEADEWTCAIDSPIPRALRVGGGSALFVSGWLFHRRSPFAALAFRLGDAEHPVSTHSMPRLDVYVAKAQAGDRPVTTSYRSGFWAVIPVAGVSEPVEAPLALVATNEAGERVERTLGTIRLLPSRALPAGVPEPGLVAICMTTYNPDLALFRRQVESIRNQTHERWRCIVSDDGSEGESYDGIKSVLAGDGRFELHRNRERLGFYFNFERALGRAPAEAEAVALCDQDDEWRPAKLAALLAELRTGHTLAYSDQRVVGPGGDVLAPSYWVERDNQWTDLGALLVSNTVTGAASLFRRDLLDVCLPFPPRLAGAYHDHWIALAALACGTIGYVDEPLYDYVQHRSQVLGHTAAATDEHPPAPRLAIGQRWQHGYFARVVPTQLVATALLERCGPRLRADDRETLAAFADGDTTLRGVLAHARSVRALRAQNGPDPLAALTGAVWRRWSSWRTRGDARPFADARHNVDGRPMYAEYGPESGAQKGSAPGRGSLPWRRK
jgi:glycosyltransferase involved in cell wall biosynthesis